MNNYEKILELLQKEQLSNEDKILIDSLIANDPEAKKIYDAYGKLKSTLSSPHLSYSDISDYVLLKGGLEPENKNIISRIGEIENHLRSCDKCSNDFKVLNEEYSEVEFFLSSELHKENLSNYEPTLAIKAIKQWWRTPVYAFSSLVVVGFLYLSLNIISDVTTPEAHQLASISDKSEFYVTRGRTTDEFQKTLKALEDNQYDAAISHLINDINNNPDDETIFYSHYILGLTYLETAGKSFIGLFPSYDKEKARLGLENFKLCIEKNSTDKFPDITYNAYFYSAKASLMLEDKDSAKEYLLIVVNEKGSKMAEAQKLLNELE